MNQLPAPLTPPDCDLSDFQYMELDVRRLRDSKFAASSDGEAFRAGILLWCAAWHQIPAGSLPDDDIELANLAGYGRVVKEWKKVRAGALHNFIKCSDGRLYHPILAEKAISAYEAKLRHAYGKLCDRIRKENAKRTKENQPLVGTPTFDQWKSGGYGDGIPPEGKTNSSGIPAENPLKGNGEGTEREQNGEGTLNTSVPNGTGADAPPEGLQPKEAIFQIALPWLIERGMADKPARSLLGAACKQLGDDGAWALASDCMREAPLEPASWLAGTLNSRMKTVNRGKPDKFSVAGLDHSSTQAAMDASMKRHGIAVPENDEIPL